MTRLTNHQVIHQESLHFNRLANLLSNHHLPVRNPLGNHPDSLHDNHPPTLLGSPQLIHQCSLLKIHHQFHRLDPLEYHSTCQQADLPDFPLPRPRVNHQGNFRDNHLLSLLFTLLLVQRHFYSHQADPVYSHRQYQVKGNHPTQQLLLLIKELKLPLKQ